MKIIQQRPKPMRYSKGTGKVSETKAFINRSSIRLAIDDKQELLFRSEGSCPDLIRLVRSNLGDTRPMSPPSSQPWIGHSDRRPERKA